MGMDFYLYEIIKKTETDSTTKEHIMLYSDKKVTTTIEQVLYLSRATANIFANWLYKNHFDKVHDYRESYGYIKIYSDDIELFLYSVNKVLEAPKEKQDLYALFYLPPIDNVDHYISNPIMFSKDYYDELQDLKKRLSKLIYDENGELLRKEFFYNISG